MKRKKRKKFTGLKKTVGNFIKDEDGFVTKDNILKVGLGTLASVGMLSSAVDAYAGPPRWNIKIWPGQNIRHGHTIANHHHNSLGLTPIAGTNCSRMQHVDGNVPITHSSTQFQLSGIGEIDHKGSKWAAHLNYDAM